MKILNLIQGTREWHQHRASHFNASDAPAMLGVSPYKTREQLIRELATGIHPEVDAATQRRFDDGHHYEALARPLAEGILGEDLFPCVGEDGKFSASFDGLTMLGDVAWEHKSLNNDLRELVWADDGSHLPDHYRVQMEHQCMVSGAERVLFMASKWEGDQLVEERHCWYTPDLELRARIVAGWTQLEADVAAYVPEANSAPVVASPVEGFGTLSLRVEGRVLASNLDAFKAGAEAFIARLPKPKDLQTDQDFADAEAAVKACAEAESRIKAAKDAALAQMADVEVVMRTADSVHDTIRAARLALDRVVKAEKEHRRAAIVAEGVEEVRAHYASINASLGEHALGLPAALNALIGETIKGKKTLDSIRNAVNTAVAAAKIEASQQAERVRANMAVLAEHQEHAHLFADRVQLCATKAPDDLRNLITARIAEHQQKEREREEAQRERIRQEEVARLERELREAAERAAREDAERAQVAEAKSHGVDVGNAQAAAPAPIPADTAITGTAHAATTGGARRIKLGEINAAIAPLSISAEGLASLGFRPVGNERAAKLYAEADLPAIYRAMVRIIQAAAEPLRKAG